MFALQLSPAPRKDILDPRRELQAKLLVERTEEAQNLDDLERRLSIKVDSFEFFDDAVNDRLEPTRILVIEDVLRRSQQHST